MTKTSSFLPPVNIANWCSLLDHWWKTKTVWPICGNLVGLKGLLPVRYVSCFKSRFTDTW